MSEELSHKGAVAWMARNPVASNLLMFLVFIGGFLGILRIKQEVFPEFDLDVVVVGVPYPGAGPEEVEQGVILAIEEGVRGVDGVKRVTSVATEGGGTVSVELLLDANPDRVLADVKGEIDRITTFPEQIEEPQVTLATRRSQVVSLIISGDQPLPTLHALAERARDGLLALPDITQVEVEGLPPLEISIDVPRETLEKYGLTLDDIALQVRMASLEVPGGGVKTAGGEVVVRVSDRRLTGPEFADIVVRGTQGGSTLRLGDIATIRDGFQDTDQQSYYDNQPAVRLVAYRVGDQTPKGVAAAVRGYAEQLRTELPDNIQLSIWDDDSELLAARMALLTKNAAFGLVLVVLVLASFLELRLALWVALGIPISFMGAFMLMPAMALSINMITLFAFIVTLGIVVDDAIVVGENVYAELEKGTPPMEAAILGTQRMVVPVAFAVLTSVAAFAPMMFVPGVMGKIFWFIPGVVIVVLLFSLLEAFFVLPAHLAHGTHSAGPWLDRVLHITDPVRVAVAKALAWFSDVLFEPLVRRVLVWRYAAISVAVAAFLGSVGLIAGGWLPFNFFPNIEGDVITASARLPYGAPVERTKLVMLELEAAAWRGVDKVADRSIVKGMFTRLGEGPSPSGPGAGPASVGSNLVTVELELVPLDERSLTTEEVGTAWASEIPELASVDALSVTSAVGPGAGAAVAVQMAHARIDVLAEASAEMTRILRSFAELKDVRNEYATGKPQFDYHLHENARTLGLTGQMVAQQVRSAFYGAEALRDQRGRNELRVMVRLPEHQRRSLYDLEHLRIRSAEGFVPLDQVATREAGFSPTEITREDSRRVVTVSGELAAGVASPREVVTSLEEDVFPELIAKYPGLQVELAGAQREQSEALGALGRNYLIALFVIYALLAVPFKSYSQPLVIMSAIPFGFVGAVAGHLIMGYSLTLISMFGVVALSGVVVNDSLVLMDAANEARAAGESAVDSVVHGATRRLRPILLTSLTTFFGLMPMIAETSIQARFLIPMAISLGFGVMFATVIILLLVPALYMVLEDVHRLFGIKDRFESEVAPMGEAQSGIV